jgi:hypothetical protein
LVVQRRALGRVAQRRVADEDLPRLGQAAAILATVLAQAEEGDLEAEGIAVGTVEPTGDVPPFFGEIGVAALVLGKADAVGGVGLPDRGRVVPLGGRRDGYHQQAEQDSETKGEQLSHRDRRFEPNSSGAGRHG